MSVLQAALIALFYAFARSAFNAGLGGYVLAQPLVAGTIAGALLGDPIRGAQIGGALNLGTLALSQLRVQVGPDVALIGYVGVPLMLLSGLRPDAPETTALFGALVVFGIALNFARGMFNTVVAHWADYFADQGNAGTVALLNVVPTQIWVVLTSFLPALFILLFDAPTIAGIAASIPAWVQLAMDWSRYLLAALGIAMSLRLVMQGSSIAYFLLGWLSAPHLGLVQATLLGGSIAVIHAFLARRRAETNAEMLVADVLPSDQAETYLPEQRLSPAELQSSFALWMFFHDAGVNFERLQNMGFAMALAPAAKRLCETASERVTLLRRSLTLFNCEWTFGASLVGALIALEERRANGEAINDAEMVGAKTGVMAGLDVIGGTVMLSAIGSLLIAAGAALADRGSLIGPFMFAFVQSALVLAVGFASFQLGYAQTRRFGDWARANNWLRPALFGAMRLGAFALGMLVVVLAPIALPGEGVIQIGAARLAVQTRVLDAILPGLLPLAATLAIWWLLRYRRISPVILMGGCLIVAVAGAAIARALGWV
ncbi:MAG: PTS system mannose/fructose/sorbose family transporter subunit IID [Anaerolineae bacterium]|nr:PTS system mannose/fructose/sorbose family transporter subunit IID [Candidatus Roseilinea sp.]MDW8448545.1 PTS system mannose/fructose/sorbose family transporter subunit IID [Anaerolineae bacterium]